MQFLKELLCIRKSMLGNGLWSIFRVVEVLGGLPTKDGMFSRAVSEPCQVVGDPPILSSGNDATLTIR